MSETKGEAAVLAHNDPMDSKPMSIISDFDAAVKRKDLNMALSSVGMATKDAATLLCTRFPKLDKSIVSKCRKPELYGCRLHEDGFTMIRLSVFGETEAVATPRVRKKSAGVCKRTSGEHRFKCRLSCRLPDEKYELFKECIRRDGYATVNDALLTLVLTYVDQKGAAYGLVSS